MMLYLLCTDEREGTRVVDAARACAPAGDTDKGGGAPQR